MFYIGNILSNWYSKNSKHPTYSIGGPYILTVYSITCVFCTMASAYFLIFTIAMFIVNLVAAWKIQKLVWQVV